MQMFRMCPAVAVVDDDEADDEADDLACHSVGKFCGQRSNNNIAKYNTCGDPFWSDFDGLPSPLSTRIDICLVPFLSRRT